MTEIVVDTTHRAEQELGPPVTIDGELRWASASLIVKADPNSEGGCARRAWFHYKGSLLGISQREPETEAMKAGTGMHKEIEDYLKGGPDGALGPIARGGKEFIDAPGPGLSVEQPIILGGHGVITGVWLRLAGVPYAGHLDLYNHRGIYITAEGELKVDPPKTLECKDWKSTSDLKWAKNSEQVANAIPMTGYAMAGFAMWPHYERARLTHVYFSRGRTRAAKLSTALRERSQIERRWEYAGSVCRSFKDAAREVNPDNVPANTHSCWSYQQWCPHLKYCKAGRDAQQRSALDDVLGPRLADMLTARVRAAQGYTDGEGDLDVGLLKKVGTVTADETGVGVTMSLEDLLAEEDAARAEVNTPKPLKPLTPIEGFFSSWKTIIDSGLGKPTLIGDAANMHETGFKRECFADVRVEGEGRLAKLEPIADATKVIELARQIKAKAEAAAAKSAVSQVAAAATAPPKPEVIKVSHNEAPIAMLPPDAPASNPALAADPVEGLDNAKTRELDAARGPQTLQDQLEATVNAKPATPPPVAPEAVASTVVDLDAVTPPPVVEPTPPAKPEPKAGKTKAKDGEAAPRRGRPPKSDDALSIYVDVTVDGLELLSLDGYVQIVNRALCEAWGCDDVRLASNETAGGYGKGPTVLVAQCLKTPPKPGAYIVDTRGNPLVELVAVALRQACLDSGGVFVRGVR